jgi:peptidoglycan/xylan/chitin deacetylase (PgdA/CDA1 family)
MCNRLGGSYRAAASLVDTNDLLHRCLMSKLTNDDQVAIKAVLKIKNTIKRLLTGTLYYTGLVWALLDLRLRRRLLVLTYHRVLPPAAWARSFSADGIIVTPETFERHMRLLRRKFDVLTPDEFAAVLEGRRTWPKRGCLVTFDDGWWDNLEFAAPVLARNQVPALLFVATDYIGTERVFWQERMSNLLDLARSRGASARPVLQGLGAAHLLEAPDDQVRVQIRKVIDGLKLCPAEQLSAKLSAITSFLQYVEGVAQPAATDRFMTWSDVAALTRSSPVTIGSHGCSHVPFTRLASDKLARELQDSRLRIRAETGLEVADLAYPNGDCDDTVAGQTRTAGYRLAFSTQRGYVARGDDLHRLRRINIHEHGTSTDASFVARLAGLT